MSPATLALASLAAGASVMVLACYAPNLAAFGLYGILAVVALKFGRVMLSP